MQCQADWFNVYGTRALDHFGRIDQPRVLTRDNAWRKRYDWNRDGNDRQYVYNYLTAEQIPITEDQYNNDSTIINDQGQLTTRLFYTPTI